MSGRADYWHKRRTRRRERDRAHWPHGDPYATMRSRLCREAGLADWPIICRDIDLMFAGLKAAFATYASDLSAWARAVKGALDQEHERQRALR